MGNVGKLMKLGADLLPLQGLEHYLAGGVYIYIITITFVHTFRFPLGSSFPRSPEHELPEELTE